MSAERVDLHRLVDRLTPSQTRALREVALHLVGDDENGAGTDAAPASDDRPRRRLSFAAVGHGDRDLSTISSEILREELGHQPPS